MYWMSGGELVLSLFIGKEISAWEETCQVSSDGRFVPEMVLG
jgi:hypothetical protein